MPELRVTETSPDIKVTLIEDDGTELIRMFNRPNKGRIDWGECRDKNGRKDLNEGKTIRLQLPEV